MKNLWVAAACGLVLIVVAPVRSGESVPADAQLLTGASIGTEEAIRGAPDIVVAAFTKLGRLGLDGSGESSYDGAKVVVQTALRGTLSGELTVFYQVRSMPGTSQEVPPVIDTQYVMFIERLAPAQYQIQKLLPATEETVTAVKGMIASDESH